MQQKLWTDSTNELLEHSGGALPTRSIGLLNQQSRPQAVPSVLEWLSIDEGTGGRVQIQTVVDITGEDIAAVSQSAWHRMVSVYIVNQLSGKYLTEACESLVDIFSSQFNQGSQTEYVVEKRNLGPASIRRVERSPIIIRED